MTCIFQRTDIALYAGGDLPPAESDRVVDHLRTCATCSLVLAEYREGLTAMAEQHREARFPEISPRRAPNLLRWVAVAVGTAMFITLLGTASPAVAALLRSLGWVKVQVLSPHEIRQYEETSQALLEELDSVTYDAEGTVRDKWGNVTHARPTRVPVEKAAEMLDFHLVLPKYLPNGVVPTGAWVVSGGAAWPVVVEFNHGQFSLEQAPPGQATYADVKAPEGTTETVQVAGEEAVVVRGHWGSGPDGQFKWQAGQSVALVWFRQNQYLRLVARDPAFSVAELVRIAESLQ